jgi:HEAT repeat protein
MRVLQAIVGMVFLSMAALPAAAQPANEPEKWIKELSSKDEEVRHAAAFSLNRCAHECRMAVPALIAMFQQGDAADRAQAGPALQQIVATVQSFAIAGLPGMTPPDEECRQILAVVRPTVRVQPEDEGISESLARMASVKLLGLCGGSAEVDVLLPLLADPSVNVRGHTVTALGELGAAAVPAVPALEKLAHDKSDAYISSLAAEALERIRPPKPTPAPAKKGTRKPPQP